MSFRASKHLSITARLAAARAASGWSCITGPAEVGCWHGWQLLPPPSRFGQIYKQTCSVRWPSNYCSPLLSHPPNFKTFRRLWLYDMELCQSTIENKVCWTTNRQFLKGHQESEQCKISSIKSKGSGWLLFELHVPDIKLFCGPNYHCARSNFDVIFLFISKFSIQNWLLLPMWLFLNILTSSKKSTKVNEKTNKKHWRLEFQTHNNLVLDL